MNNLLETKGFILTESEQADMIIWIENISRKFDTEIIKIKNIKQMGMLKDLVQGL